ncbi:MAG: Ig-like domain-containing protein, partial [Methanomassiliicoccales archaeon]
MLPTIHYGVFLRNCNAGKVVNNIIYEINEAIELEHCNAVEIGRNSMKDCVIGVFLDQASTRAFIHNNTFENMQEWGITLNYEAQNTTIVDNFIKNCSWAGIDVAHSNDALIKSNKFINCTHGVLSRPVMIGSNLRLNIFHNIFEKCGQGISLNLTYSSLITYNAFISCSGYGVYMNQSAAGNIVHHNVFIDCNSGGIQAFDYVAGANKWNTTGFGNHWNDMTSPDAEDDGIVDVNYVLDGAGSVDNYPLTYTIGPAHGLQAVVGGNSVLFTWNACNYSAGAIFASPESNYILHRYGGTNGTKNYTSVPGIEEWNDATVVPGTTYIYEVICNNTYGRSSARNYTVPVPAGNVPKVKITSPADGSLFNVNSVTLEWKGSENNGSAITKYEVRLDNGNFIDKGLATNHTFTDLSDGKHKLTVKIYNADGNTGYDAINVTIDTTPPLLFIISPTEGSKNNTGSIKVTWTASDATSGVKNYSLRVNSSEWKQQNLNTSYEITDLQNGTYLIEVRAFDNAGNSVIRKVNVTVDRAAPVVTFLEPTDNSFTSNVNFTAKWNITDDSGVNSTWARLVDPNGVALPWYNLTGKNSTWITNLTLGGSNLSEGRWQLHIAANDTLGNNATSIVQFTVDITPPVLEILQPINGNYNNTGVVIVIWNIIEDNLDYFEYRINSGSWINVATNTSQELILADGVYNFEVKAVDKAGLSSIASVNFIVDTVPPAIDSLEPADGSYLNTNTPIFVWNVVESTSGVNRTIISLDDVVEDIGLAQSYTVLSPLEPGWHWFNITIYDNATNFFQASVHFYVDITGPTVIILSPSDGDMLNQSTVQIIWIGSDAHSGVAYYEYDLDSSGWTYYSGQDGTHSKTFNLMEGYHTFKVRAFDLAGNPSNTAIISFLVDLTAPELSVLMPNQDEMFALDEVTIAWNATDNLSGIAHYEVSIDGGSWILVGLDTNYTFTGLADGNHTAYVKAVDKAGNYNVTSVSFVTDITPPDVVILTPAEGEMFAVDTVYVQWNTQDNTTGLWYWWVWVDGEDAINVTSDNYTFTG